MYSCACVCVSQNPGALKHTRTRTSSHSKTNFYVNSVWFISSKHINLTHIVQCAWARLHAPSEKKNTKRQIDAAPNAHFAHHKTMHKLMRCVSVFAIDILITILNAKLLFHHVSHKNMWHFVLWQTPNCQFQRSWFLLSHAICKTN